MTKTPKYAILFGHKMQILWQKGKEFMLFKLNFNKSNTKKALKIAILSIMTISLVFPSVVKAENDKNGLISAIKSFFGQEVFADDEGDLTFPVAEDREPVKTIWVTITAYSSTVDQCDSTPCITANGFDLCKNYEEKAVADTIAANFLKFGTRVRLPDAFGDQVFVVRDRMNAKYNGQNRIDVWMPTREEAIAFGVKRIKMEVY